MDNLSEFRRLLEDRDLAAYRAVAAIDTIFLFFEAQDYDTVFSMLSHAREEFRRAEQAIHDFQQSHKFQPQGDHSHVVPQTINRRN